MFFDLLQRFNLKRLNKHVAVQNLSIYYTRKNMTLQGKSNNHKILASTSNDEFELPHGSFSVSDIHKYIEYIVKKHETSRNPRLLFKIKDEYQLELQTPQTMKLFSGTKELIGKKWRKCTTS